MVTTVLPPPPVCPGCGHHHSPFCAAQQSAEVLAGAFEQATRASQAYNAVKAERKFQDDKWGTVYDHPHTLGEWILIAEAELAEAKLAIIKGGTGRNSVRSELIQTAAVLLAALEQHGVVEPHDGRQI